MKLILFILAVASTVAATNALPHDIDLKAPWNAPEVLAEIHTNLNNTMFCTKDRPCPTSSDDQHPLTKALTTLFRSIGETVIEELEQAAEKDKCCQPDSKCACDIDQFIRKPCSKAYKKTVDLGTEPKGTPILDAFFRRIAETSYGLALATAWRVGSPNIPAFLFSKVIVPDNTVVGGERLIFENMHNPNSTVMDQYSTILQFWCLGRTTTQNMLLCAMINPALHTALINDIPSVAKNESELTDHWAQCLFNSNETATHTFNKEAVHFLFNAHSSPLVHLGDVMVDTIPTIVMVIQNVITLHDTAGVSSHVKYGKFNGRPKDRPPTVVHDILELYRTLLLNAQWHLRDKPLGDRNVMHYTRALAHGEGMIDHCKSVDAIDCLEYMAKYFDMDSTGEVSQVLIDRLGTILLAGGGGIEPSKVN